MAPAPNIGIPIDFAMFGAGRVALGTWVDVGFMAQHIDFGGIGLDIECYPRPVPTDTLQRIASELQWVGLIALGGGNYSWCVPPYGGILHESRPRHRCNTQRIGHRVATIPQDMLDRGPIRRSTAEPGLTFGPQRELAACHRSSVHSEPTPMPSPTQTIHMSCGRFMGR